MNTDNATGPYINAILIENNIDPTITINGTGQKAKVLVESVSNVLKASVTGDKSLSLQSLKDKGFAIEDMLVSCFFNNMECNTTDFKWKHSNEHGNCYTFNEDLTMPSKTVSKAGPKYGLNLELYAGRFVNNYYMLKNGMHLFVHERGVLPLFTNEGIDLQTGVASSITISRTKYEKAEPPYSSCRKDTSVPIESDSDIFKQTLQVSVYRQKVCYELCVQNLYVIPNCNCSDPSKFILFMLDYSFYE